MFFYKNKNVSLGGAGVIEKKDADRRSTTKSGIYPQCCCGVDRCSIATVVCETLMDGIGGAAVGQQPGNPAVCGKRLLCGRVTRVYG